MNLKLTQDELLYILQAIEIYEDVVSDFCNPARTSLLEKLEKLSEKNFDFRLNLEKQHTANGTPYYHYLPTHLFGLSKEEAAHRRHIEEVENQIHAIGKITFFECLNRIAVLIATYIEDNYLYRLSHKDELLQFQLKLTFRFNEIFAPYPEALKLLDPRIYLENYQIKIQLCKKDTAIDDTRSIPIEYTNDILVRKLFETEDLFD